MWIFLQIEGLGLAVKKALVAVTSRLQEFPPPEGTVTHPPPRLLESGSFPVKTVDLPQQRTPILQPTPSNNINHEKVSYMNSTGQQQEVFFKILCPNDQVGSIIGKGGSIIKGIQNETGASVIIGSNVADCDERLITLTAMEVKLVSSLSYLSDVHTHQLIYFFVCIIRRV